MLGVPAAPPLLVVVGLGEQQIAQVVQVPSVASRDVPEESLMGHLQHGQLLAPVAAVLHQEAVQALLLGDVHQGPQLVQLGGDRRFDADVLAAPQRGRRLGVVLLPGGGDVDEVDVVGLRQALVVVRTAGVLPRPAGALGGQAVRGFPDPLPAHVGDRGDPHPRDRVEQRQHPHAAVAEADDPHPDLVVGLERHADHARLGAGPGGEGAGRPHRRRGGRRRREGRCQADAGRTGTGEKGAPGGAPQGWAAVVGSGVSHGVPLLGNTPRRVFVITIRSNRSRSCNHRVWAGACSRHRRAGGPGGLLALSALLEDAGPRR